MASIIRLEIQTSTGQKKSEAAIIIPWMGHFINDKASSVAIKAEVESTLTIGRVPNLQPACKVIKKEQFDFFDELGMNNTLSSFKFECGR